MRNAGLLAVGLALAAAAITLVPRPVHHAPRPQVVVPQAPIETEFTPVHPEIGFRTRERLVEHYRKHGREFGSINMDRYLRLAQALRDRPAGGMILEAVRGDGVIVRYDKSSGAFIAFNRDGTIRSFFRPDRGDAYFRSQLQRGH